MRTLSAELTAAQQASNNNPYVEIVLSSKDGATIETYTTEDATNRILRVRTAEGMYGGALFEVNLPNGKAVGIAAQIVLNNSANTFTSKDYRGYRVKVRLGFVSYWDGAALQTISGTKFSEGEPFIVFNQRDSTSEGLSVTELWCISVWEALEILSIHGDSFGDLYRTTGSNIRQILMSALCFEATQIWTFDNSSSTFVDETNDLKPLANSGAAPWKVDTNDILYVGVDDNELNEFDRLSIEQDIEGAGNWNAAYEYSKGAGVWGVLSDVVDNTDSGSGVGTDVKGSGSDPVPRVISFTHPSDWAANTVNSVSKRYIRIRITSQISQTTEPSILRIGVSKTWGFQIDDTDTFDIVLKPEYDATLETSRRDIFRDILSMTRYAAVMTDTFMRVNLFDDSPASTDYDYNLTPGHVFFSSQRERAVVIPNKIIAARVDNEGAVTNFIGTAADDSASQADVGVVLELIIDNSIKQASDGTTRAVRRLSRYQHELFQGEVTVPINIGQEPWDWIGVTDGRLSVSYTGRVGRIIREYDWNTSSYKSQITLGILRSVPTEGLGTAVGRIAENIVAGANDAINQTLIKLLEAFRTQGFPGLLGFKPDEQVVRAPGEGLISPVLNDPTPKLLTVQPTDVGSGALSRVTQIPDIPLARGNVPVGLPFWHGLAPGTGNYKQVPRQQANTRGIADDNPRFHTIFLRDFLGGGYAPVQMYQDGLGNLVIDGKTGTGTDLDAIVSQLAYHISDPNVAHGMTDQAPTTTAAIMRQLSSSGGLDLIGWNGPASSLALFLRGNANIETSQPLLAPIVLIAAIKSGTGITTIANGNNLVAIRNNATAVLNIRGNGDIIPVPNGVVDLGGSSNFWANGHINAVTADILLPKSVGNSDIGNINNHWEQAYVETQRSNFVQPRTAGQPIVLDQDADDNAILTMRNDDVAHGVTDFLPNTKDFASFQKVASVTGGLRIAAGKESATGEPVLALRGIGTLTDTTKDINATGYIELQASKANGTGVQDLGTNEIILAVRANSSTRFILDADGDSHQDVGTAWTNFDDEDDAILLRDFANAVSQDSIRTQFGEFLVYNKGKLEELGLVSFTGPTPFVNMSRLTMLHTGAIWQLHTKYEELDAKIAELDRKLKALIGE